MKVAIDEISVTPAAVARALGAVALLVVLANLAGQIARFAFGHDTLHGIVPLFDLNGEENVPAFFSLLLLVSAAGLLAGVARLERIRGTRHASKWAILSVGFLAMGYDEAFQVHERLIVPMRQFVGGGTLGVLWYAWVVPALALVAVLAVVFLDFLRQLPTPTRRRFLAAAALYLTGAIGMEMVGGQFVELHRTDHWEFSAMVMVEESLEMTGVIYFIWAILKHCADQRLEVRLQFGDRVASRT